MAGTLEDNRNRLVNLLRRIPDSDCPEGWEYKGGIAISGFIGFGFSKRRSNFALIVSTSGRSLINCDTVEKVARDYEEFEGLEDSGIYCKGLEELSDESILIAGQNGGGLPNGTCIGESLRIYSPNWPQHDLYFCGPSGDPLFERFQGDCIKLRADFIEAFGFSWCGDYFIVASNCDLDIWRRK